MKKISHDIPKIHVPKITHQSSGSYGCYTETERTLSSIVNSEENIEQAEGRLDNHFQ